MLLRNRFRTAVLPSATFLPHCVSIERPPLEPGSALVLGNPTGDLDGAEDEARAVAATLGVDPLLQHEATCSAFLEGAAGCSVVHVACHGTYNADDPLLSGLEFADGLVTVEDIMGSTLDASLVVLSGCVTGLAMRHPGDELVGLARAAVSAGAPTVATTLWNTDDSSSERFWTGFYRHLAVGASKSEALWHAQSILLGDGLVAAPRHWAPFVLLGDWR